MFVLHVVYRSYFSVFLFFFFFNDTATTEIYTLSLHDALPIYHVEVHHRDGPRERHYRPAHVVTRADQAKLFGAEQRDDERAAHPAGRRERARQAEGHGRAGGVVIRAGVDDAIDATEMIVVRADDDGFVGERRVGAGQEAHDVHAADFVGHDVDPNPRARARREWPGRVRRGEGIRRLGRRAARGGQHGVGRLTRERPRHETDSDRRLVR